MENKNFKWTKELIQMIEFDEISLSQILPQGVRSKHVENDVRSLLNQYLEQDIKINSLGQVLDEKGFVKDIHSGKHEINPQSFEMIVG